MNIITDGITYDVKSVIKDGVEYQFPGVSQEEYDELLEQYNKLVLIDGGLLSGVTIGQTTTSWSSHSVYLFGIGPAYLSAVGNYVFCVGRYGEKDISSNTYTFDGWVGIFYKTLDSHTWSFVQSPKLRLSSRDSNNADMYMSVSFDGNNTINAYLNITGNFGGGSVTQYYDWVVGNNSITASTEHQRAGLPTIYQSSTYSISGGGGRDTPITIGFKID